MDYSMLSETETNSEVTTATTRTTANPASEDIESKFFLKRRDTSLLPKAPDCGIKKYGADTYTWLAKLKYTRREIFFFLIKIMLCFYFNSE